MDYSTRFYGTCFFDITYHITYTEDKPNMEYTGSLIHPFTDLGVRFMDR